MKKLILASKSPRRKELMLQAGFDYEIVLPEVEERITKQKPDEVVMELSLLKAENVYDKLLTSSSEDGDLDICVIGADTVVAVDDKILGKPKDDEDAGRMLRSIQGRSHMVYTGVAFVYTDKLTNEKRVKSFCEATAVSLYPMTDEEIDAYITSGNGRDKAGSYGVQGPFAVYVKGIDGDYNNVVGLPIARLYQEMKEIKDGN